MAIATALAFTGRQKVLVFSNGYHGGTLSFPASHSTTQLSVNLPHDFIIAPYNSISGTKAILDTIPAETLAAILVEPVQGSGGCIPGSQEFLQYLETSARTLGAIFIVDEVMTSRLAASGLSSELGLTPDLITLGKWVGGGMTFGAFGGRKDIMSLYDPRNSRLTHSGTFNNNIVTMAAGVAGIDIFNDVQVARLNALGDKLRSGIQDVLERNRIGARKFKPLCPERFELESPFTGTTASPPSSSHSNASKDKDKTLSPRMSVTGYGSMLCVHFDGDSEKSLRALFWHHMLEEDIYLAPRGFIALNMEIGEADVEKFVAAVERFIGKYRGALMA
jgi:glutamate-1-semialdehyde 2,1-aminomutase